MEVRLLGPVGLWRADREIASGAPQQRLVLAALAIAPGEPVTAADLVTRVWGDCPPGGGRNVLQTHVSRLRGLVARAAGVPRSQAIRRTGDSYLLAMAPEQVDLCRARRLVAEARQIAGDGPSGDRAAIALAQRAVELRHGTPLAGLRGRWVEQARVGIEREWLAWQAERFEAELRLGQPAAVAGPLSALLANYPLDERLAQLLMLALHRTGQQSEALQVYGQIRQRLIEELGDEPGARLQRLHQRVLRRDPQLDDPSWLTGEPAGSGPTGGSTGSPAPRAGRPAAVRPMQLPPDVPNFTGRAAQLRQLDSLLHSHATSRSVAVITAVAGMAGVGKTTLAIHWGHRVRGQFPDGQLYVDLRGYAPGSPRSAAGVLAKFLRSLGTPADQVPVDDDEAAALYRSILADRTLLILLDNAADSAQVRPLLPGAGGSVVVVTSRAALTGLVVREGAHRLNLDLLTEPESIDLLAALLGADRVAAEPAAASELARRCGYLPLALRVAAASLPPPGQIADQVAQLRERGSLPVLAGAGEVDAVVPAIFDLSYDRLQPLTRLAFRLLGLFPGSDLSADALAPLAGVAKPQAEAWLAELAQAHLVKPVAPGRYICHDLLREYALGRVRAEEATADRRAALGRLFQHCLRTADAASLLLYPFVVRLPSAGGAGPALAAVGFREPADALAWLDAERLNLVAVTERAAVAGAPELAWRMADAIRSYFFHGMYFTEGVAVAEAGLAAAESAGSLAGQAASRLQLAAILCYSRDRKSEAMAHAHQAVEQARDNGWLDGQAAAHNLLGNFYINQGDSQGAIGHYQLAAALHKQTGSTIGLAMAMHNLGYAHLEHGPLQQAAACTRQAEELIAQTGPSAQAALPLINLGEIHRQLGEFDLALDCHRRVVDLCRPARDRFGEASGRKGAAQVLRDTGQYRQALAAVDAALAIARNVGRLELEADSVRVRAHVLGLLGEHQQSVDGQRQAVEQARRAGYRYVEADALIGLAQAHRWLGERQPAEARLAEALALTRAGGMRILEGQALVGLAELRLNQGDATSALSCAQAALAAHRETGHRPGEADTLSVLARAHQQLGAGEAADRYRREACTLRAELGLPAGALPTGPA